MGQSLSKQMTPHKPTHKEQKAETKPGLKMAKLGPLGPMNSTSEADSPSCLPERLIFWLSLNSQLRLFSHSQEGRLQQMLSAHPDTGMPSFQTDTLYTAQLQGPVA